ncbi:hypothetical protein D3C79_645980 [compost metagenome]
MIDFFCSAEESVAGNDYRQKKSIRYVWLITIRRQQPWRRLSPNPRCYCATASCFRRNTRVCVRERESTSYAAGYANKRYARRYAAKAVFLGRTFLTLCLRITTDQTAKIRELRKTVELFAPEYRCNPCRCWPSPIRSAQIKCEFAHFSLNNFVNHLL